VTQTSRIINVEIKMVAAIILWCFLACSFMGMNTIADNGKPDLTLLPDSIVITPEDIYEYDQVKINVTIKNTGGSAAENIGVALYINSRNNHVDEHIISSLETNEESTVILYWIAQPVGNHTFFIFLDFNEQIDETNEDNNIGSGTFDVQQPVYPPFPPEPINASWWNPAFHYRVPLTVTMLGQWEGYVYEDKTVTTAIDFTELMNTIATYQPSGGFSKRTFLPDSVRVINYERINDSWEPQKSLGREIIFSDDYDAADKANVTLIWVMDGDTLPHEARHYYMYWDTVENEEKSGAFDAIATGIKNSEFEDDSLTVWRNESKPVLPVSGATDVIGWDLGYVDDPVDGNDQCYRIHREGFLWQQEEYYARLYQSFTVPDGGDASSYFLNADIYFDADFDAIEWEIALDGNIIDQGGNTDGWEHLRKDVTTHLEGKTSFKPTVSFKVTATENTWATTTHEVSAYIDSCWIEITPNPSATTIVNGSHGWWGNIGSIASTYAAGVDGMNTIEIINSSAIAHPREVIATLYSPSGQFVTSSLPIPDAGFEGGDVYTQLFISNEQTASASFSGSSTVHSGSKAVELRLSDYSGNYQFMDEPVQPEDTVGLYQTIAQSVHISRLPILYFWYKIDQYATLSELNYTVLIEGGHNKFLSISMGALTKDDDWHKYQIPAATLNKWKASAGTVVGLEIRLIANVQSGENTVYIDDLGYAFMPAQNGANRKNWYLEDFYTFQSDAQTGTWRLDVSMADGSDYIVVQSKSIQVQSAADLDVVDISAPDSIKEGKETTITVTIKNVGAKSVPLSTPVNVSLTIYQGQTSSNATKMVKALDGIAADATRSVTFTWWSSYGNPAEAGEWKTEVRVDSEKQIPDSDRNNNWNIFLATVIPLPDLQIYMSDIDFDVRHPFANTTVNISVIVHNLGYNDTLAEINFYIKEVDSRTYTLITGGTVIEIISKRSSTTITLPWQPSRNGTFSIKVGASCEDESTLANNAAIKDIRVGGPFDQNPPEIRIMQIVPSVQFLGGYVNISAVITDNQTTINNAILTVSRSENTVFEKYMRRLGETDIYYYTVTFNEVGYYTCRIDAFDTAGDPNGMEWQHTYSSDILFFRVIYEGVETSPPTIRAVVATPQKQVIFGMVNISALINDSSGLRTVTLHVLHDGDEQTYNMSLRGTTDIYYFSQSYDETGTYEYYIEAVDASANRNKYDTSQLYRFFTIPDDYDGDDVPDTVEIEVGADPKDRDTTINVSVGTEVGYLLMKEDTSTYVYWSKAANEFRSIEERSIDEHKAILFDADGDGSFDHYYDTVIGTVMPFEEISEAGLQESVWVIPAVVLFGVICALFIAIRKRS